MADLKGLKRICMSCGARFYDLNKKPIVCPSCAVEFTGEIKVKARRGRLPADDEAGQVDEDTAVEETVEAETEEVESDGDTVSLEEIDEDTDADEDESDIDIDADEIENLDDEDLDDIDDDDIDEDIAEDDEDK